MEENAVEVFNHYGIQLIVFYLGVIHQDLLSMEPRAAAKKLSVGVAVPPAAVRVPSQRPLAPSVASVTSVANDKGDDMILGAVHRSSGICRTAEENL